MRNPIVLCALFLWAGVAILLADVRWFRRPPLIDRLRPYAPAQPGSAPSGAGGTGGAGGAGGVRGSSVTSPWSVESFRDVLAPLARSVGEAASRAFGVGEDLALRLQRIHSPFDVSTFRVRQLGWATAAFGFATVVDVLVGLPAILAVFTVMGAPVLAFLILEQRVVSESAAWQRRIFLELPVMTEQLAMLLNAGYSLGGALNRLAQRGRGACAQDLAVVCGRVRQGLTEAQALSEWASVARVGALDRILPVLSRAVESSDLGRLLSAEAKAIRQEVQRQQLATIERRAQQVWIPVTVATLVPGVIFLAIPFIDALRRLSGA